MRVLNKMKKETGAALCEYLLLCLSVVVIGIPAIRMVGTSSFTTLDSMNVHLGGESHGSTIWDTALSLDHKAKPSGPGTGIK